MISFILAGELQVYSRYLEILVKAGIIVERHPTRKAPTLIVESLGNYLYCAL